jgi:hypothetical protein
LARTEDTEGTEVSEIGRLVGGGVWRFLTVTQRALTAEDGRRRVSTCRHS